MPKHLTRLLTLLAVLLSGASSALDATHPATAPLELMVLGSGGPGATGRAASCYLILIDGIAFTGPVTMATDGMRLKP
jgi:hypothetical protein